MSRTIMLIPTGANVGLTSVSLGVIRAMERQGVRLSVLKPISQSRVGNQQDQTTSIIQAQSKIAVASPLDSQHVQNLISANQEDVLLEEIVARYEKIAENVDVVLVEGIIPTSQHQYASKLNAEIAKALDAEIVLVMSQNHENNEQLNKRIELVRASLGGVKNDTITGVIINKINAPDGEQAQSHPDLSELYYTPSQPSSIQENTSPSSFITNSSLPILGGIPWNIELIASRAIDIATHLNAEIINEGEIKTRRIRSISFCARSIPNMLNHFRPGALLVTSADRPDVVIAACLAAMNGVELGALLLTGGYEIDSHVQALCERAFATGLPVLKINSNTWQTALQLQNFNIEVPADDQERIAKMQDFVAGFIDTKWIESLSANIGRARRLSPPAFRYQLTELARQAHKRIVLPEGDEPRTIKAAAICAERGIAECILLADPEEVKRVAAAQDVTLGNGIQIINPADVREQYVARLVELRKSKGLTEIAAREQLEDNVVLGTMMLEADAVDGLVSGAVHTTANTIRPPLQIIKTAPGSSLVSSVFFMLLPDQVLVYGDCAINPDPTAEQLAEIAIQSADSAIAFGIQPKVAMISYSTGNSGSGSDVEKVREATRIAKEKRPDLLLDGPLQYDAAVMADVAKSKAPNSPVAGHANVFIFPDLNTGNTTYKAVQRSADLVSIGPMLQGMRKPVNDLSRGALVDDIVYTIALTAIQAKQND